jgi:hypothetical protein
MALAADQDSDEGRHPWDGFPKGSWIIISSSLSKDGATETKTEKQVRIDSNGSLMLSARAEGKMKGRFDGKERAFSSGPPVDPARAKNWKLVETSNKELTIEGKKYPCEVKKYESKSTDTGRETVVSFWHCKGVSLPDRRLGRFAIGPDVLRIEAASRGKRGPDKGWIQVASLKSERQVGGRKIICVKEEGELEEVFHGKKESGKLTRWCSNEVPGWEVAVIGEGEADGKKVTHKVEVLDFEVAKKK